MTTRRKAQISAFIIAWSLVFHYEALRYQALTPLTGRNLPKFKFLFPPLGWIMFCRIEDSALSPEVFGLSSIPKITASPMDNDPPAPPWESIEPRRIFPSSRASPASLLSMLTTPVDDPSYGPDFCRYLHRKLPEYRDFAITEATTPSLIRNPSNKIYRIVYKCRR